MPKKNPKKNKATAKPKPKRKPKRITRADQASERKLRSTVRDQFGVLGRFTQDFEFLISVIREDCAWIIRGGELRSWDVKGEALLFYWNITSLSLHHEAMTAKPLADIWRALLYEYCGALVAIKKLTPEGQKIVSEIASKIQPEISELSDRRNRLLHASWHIGRWAPFEDIEALAVEKFRVTKEGLQKRTDLPKSADEVLELCKWANRLSSAVGRLAQFVRFAPGEIESKFVKQSGKWVFLPTSQVVSPTSPEKPQ